MTRQTVTAKNGTEAFKMIHDFLGKEISFSNVSEGYNREDIFTFTAGEGIFISATCAPGNSRVECIEIINTNEGGSARHPLTVYINTDDAQSINTPIIETVEITEDGNEFRRFTVNNETVTYFNGELNFIKSDTYHASLAAYRNQYVVEVPDGRWKKFKRLDVDEFHQVMCERGACSIDGKPEPPVAPQSDFAAKLAALKDAYDKAEKVVTEKKIVLDEAEKEYHAAGNISTAALGDLQTFLLDAREQLTKELLADIESPYEIAITAHNGLTYKTKLRDAFFLFGNVGEYITFLVCKEASCINWNLATYDTLAQMKIAIEMLKAAIARGDKSFTFPTAKTADACQENFCA